MITQLLRKVRATVIVIIAWLLCWIPFAVGLDHVLTDILVPKPIDYPYAALQVWVIWGALSGLGFAIMLALGERGRGAGSLSTVRVLSWGAIGAALVPLLYIIIRVVARSWPSPTFAWPFVLLTIAESALLGFCSAIGVLALMRAGMAREHGSHGAA